MELLNVSNAAVSRPSLLSNSIWSIQVQTQNDINPLLDCQGSQQSLPQMLDTSTTVSGALEHTIAGNNETSGVELQKSKSLSELMPSRDPWQYRIFDTPSFLWRREVDGGSEKHVAAAADCPSSRLSATTPNTTVLPPAQIGEGSNDRSALSQQKERNICDWLQQVDLNSANKRLGASQSAYSRSK